jgi:energy-coupling factor transporter transmembrane protein EcfT
VRALAFGGFSIFFVADLDHEQFAASMIRFVRVPPGIAVAFEARGLDDGPRTFRTAPRFGVGDALFLSVYVLLLVGTLVLIDWEPWSGRFSE